jgi:hypothetical protein
VSIVLNLLFAETQNANVSFCCGEINRLAKDMCENVKEVDKGEMDKRVPVTIADCGMENHNSKR